MKKIMSNVLTILCTTSLLLLGACSQSDSANGTVKSEGNSNGEKTYVLKYSHVVPEEHATHLASLEFKKEVEDKSQGRITVEIYPNGQLYASEREAIEATMLGNLDMTFIGAPALASFDKQFMVLDLPFLFETREAAHKALDGELGNKLNEVLNGLELVGLAWGESGYKHMLNNKKPITSPDDLTGMKIRIMENKLYQDTFSALGANATPHAFGEVYSALQQGTFDGMDAPVSLIYSNKFNEVQKYMSLTGHVYASAPLIINKNSLEQLPEDLQKVVKDAAKNQIGAFHRDLAFKQDSEQMEELKQKGLQVNELTAEQKQAFIDKLQPIYKDYEEKLGKNLIDLAKSFNQ